MSDLQLGFTFNELSPAYVNVLRYGSGDIQLTVRSHSPDGGASCGTSAVVSFARADFVKFFNDAIAEVAFEPQVEVPIAG